MRTFYNEMTTNEKRIGGLINLPIIIYLCFFSKFRGLSILGKLIIIGLPTTFFVDWIVYRVYKYRKSLNK